MTATILGIVSLIVGAVWFLVKRSILRADDPEQIKENRREEIHRNLFKRDSVSDSVRVNDLLRSIQDRAERQGGNHAAGKSKDDRAA